MIMSNLVYHTQFFFFFFFFFNFLVRSCHFDISWSLWVKKLDHVFQLYRERDCFYKWPIG